MKCENKDREEKITLYLDRQLDWKEEKEFLKHIKTCPECKHELQQAQQLRQMLLDMPIEPFPEGLHESIMKSLEKEMSPAKKRIAWQKYGVLAACFLLLTFAGKQFYQKAEQGTEQAVPQIASMALEEAAEPVGTTEEITEERSYPTITQSRSAGAPETSKALPATPNLTADSEKQDEEEGDTIEGDIAEEGMEATEEENIESGEQPDTEKDVLSQPVSEGENTKEKEEKVAEKKEKYIESEIDKQQSKNTLKKSAPVNMKSKSLQIKLKTKNIEKVIQNIEKRTKAWKGEIETPYTQDNMTIKVPLLEYNDVVNWLGQQCEVIDKNEITEDLAKQYKEIQQQADNAKEKEEEATKKDQPRKAQEARKIQKDCEKALEELQKTAEFAVIHISFIEV